MTGNALNGRTVTREESDFRRRQADIRDGIGQESAGIDRFLQCLEIGAGLESLIHAGWIKKDPDWICSKLRGTSHEFSRKPPIGKVVALQFNEVALGVLVVERHRHPMIEAECRLEARFSQAVKRKH